MSKEIPKAEAAQLSTPYKPHNFTTAYTVTLPQPLSTVFPVLAYGENIERSIRCYGFCTDFELYHADAAQLPADKPLVDSQMRLVAPSAAGGLTRQWFRMQETIPLLFGLYKQKVEVVGCQTWDEEAKAVLYESVTDQGILIWKLRTFEEVDDGGVKTTKVTEVIKGTCPGWMKWIVKREATEAHK